MVRISNQVAAKVRELIKARDTSKEAVALDHYIQGLYGALGLEPTEYTLNLDTMTFVERQASNGVALSPVQPVEAPKPLQS